jgi:hypothetical protein
MEAMMDQYTPTERLNGSTSPLNTTDMSHLSIADLAKLAAAEAGSGASDAAPPTTKVWQGGREVRQRQLRRRLAAGEAHSWGTDLAPWEIGAAGSQVMTPSSAGAHGFAPPVH